MISVKRAVKPAVFRTFAVRTAAVTDQQGFMRSQGAAGKSSVEIERSWLTAKGGGTTGNINTQWGAYLSGKGINTGSLKERMKNFMNTGSQA